MSKPKARKAGYHDPTDRRQPVGPQAAAARVQSLRVRDRDSEHEVLRFIVACADLRGWQ